MRVGVSLHFLSAERICLEISWIVKGFITKARIPCCPNVSPLTLSLNPVQRMTGYRNGPWPGPRRVRRRTCGAWSDP